MQQIDKNVVDVDVVIFVVVVVDVLSYSSQLATYYTTLHYSTLYNATMPP